MTDPLDLESLRRVRASIDDRHNRAHHADNYFERLMDELESTRAELARVTAERDKAFEVERARWESARKAFGPLIRD